MPDKFIPPLVRALLSDPACYDHPVGELQLIQTHISWVVLTGRYAYKIKKPVDLGFLDFSTLELRRQDCIEELRLNRRLAGEMYLDVVAITGSVDAPRISAPPLLNPTPHVGEGANESLREVNVNEILEYAVKMRQFPADATLDHLAERGELGNLQIDALAKRLAHFHLFECERAPAESAWGEPEAIALPVDENFKILAARLDHPGDIQRLAVLQRWSCDEHVRLAPLMRERKSWVRECHGDLHLANLAWMDGQLVIFDCLEFNPALRWIDVMSEVAFCYMDLLHRQYGDLASRFLNAWLETVGDYSGVPLLRYYAVYRALVRAKVAALRVEQGGEDSAEELTSCLKLAEQLSRHEPPMLMITHGLSGSGKTTLSQRLLEEFGMIRLRSDVERKRMAGFDPLEKTGTDMGGGLYTRHASRQTYQHLADLAEGLLKSGWQVVVDAAFLERDQRDLFRDLACRLGVRYQILHIQTDPAVLRERISRRQALGNDASEADLRVLQHQIETAQPLGDDELPVTMNPHQAGLRI